MWTEFCWRREARLSKVINFNNQCSDAHSCCELDALTPRINGDDAVSTWFLPKLQLPLKHQIRPPPQATFSLSTRGGLTKFAGSIPQAQLSGLTQDSDVQWILRCSFSTKCLSDQLQLHFIPYSGEEFDMAWIALISSLLVLWFASLCKVFLESLSASKAAFLHEGVSSRRRNVLVVIAHPDDESMFFAPVINYLTSRHHNVHILCMSTGNADGMGNIRKEELLLASAVLKIPAQQVTVLDHPDLQDGFGKLWNWNLLASIIDEETRTHSIDLIITFDNYGISGHCNHCDVHQGVRKLLHDASRRHLEAWEIVSPNIVRKYIGPVDIWLSILFSRFKKDGQPYCLLNLDLRKSYAAMAQHSSQWVWFRKLFVTFSSCTYVSTLKKIV